MATFAFIGFFLLVFLLAGCAVYPDRVHQTIRDFFDNRHARKIAKKIGLIDKGLIPVTFIKKSHSKYEEVVTVHTFCGNRARIGLFEKEPVKWCPTCEKVLSEGDDEDDDDRGKKPSTPLTPVDPKELAWDTIEKAKKKEPHPQ